MRCRLNESLGEYQAFLFLLSQYVVGGVPAVLRACALSTTGAQRRTRTAEELTNEVAWITPGFETALPVLHDKRTIVGCAKIPSP